MVADSGARYRDLLELARRLQAYDHPEGPISAEIVPRGWPAAHEADMPEPRDAQLLGSELHSVAGRPLHMTAIFDATSEPGALVRAYESELQKSGWDVFEQFGGMHGGFVPGGLAGLGKAFRRGNAGPVLMVSAMTTSVGASELRLRLDWQMPRHLPSRHHGQAGAERMPILYPPSGVRLQPRGGGGSAGSWHSDALTTTDRPAGELESHFADQLKEAGWKRLDGRADEVVAWSSWQLPGKGNWRGLLLVLGAFGHGQRVLALRIESGEADAEG